ncbi:MAG: cysteine--tRNA ligase [Lachnospiraceae bacterium]|nr:cysteine--tRNA ligase [Lachnospiraceae bacterium]
MKIYNTLNNRKEEFVPIQEGKVGIYVCGPTVYNLIHIGNARPMIVFDTVRRYFEYKGYEVNYVSNFTDVDDKIIKAANEEGVSASEISERYIKECKQDMEHMNVRPATTHPKATEEIDGMIELIESLIEKGYAYEVNGTVYYRVKAFQGYGKLSGKNIEDMEAGHRDLLVDGESEKEDALDFVLWKPKKEGEPFWKSPWGDGRPGWHTECSVMSRKYIGETLDIHAGGEDLVFPHHENEIAQSEAANGVKFANYWMHNAFLNIDNHKMSKSLGNFFTVRDIEKKFPLQILRFFMLSVHYRSPLNFSDTLVQSAANGLDRILTAEERLKGLLSKNTEGVLTDAEEEISKSIDSYVNKYEEAMDDDFNTADAIAAIFELVKLANVAITEESSHELIKKAYDTIAKLLDVLGIKAERAEESIDDKVQEMIDKRQEARKNKDFALADQIRDELLNMGIELKDTREGVKWKRI